jgi:hypothetical protein
MKHHYLLAAIVTLIALFGAVSCSTAERQQLASNATQTVLAAGTGYLVGGKAGAVSGATAQELRNLEGWRTRTAAKNPGKSVTP